MKYYHIVMLFLIVCFTGCTTSSKPIGGGYYLRTTHYFSWEPPGVSESLFFRGSHGVRSRVWKNFTGPILVEGSTALFVGTARPGEYELFAVKDGAPRLEVGKTILAFEAQRKGADVPAFVDQHQIHTWYLKRLTNGFELQYSQRRGVNNPYQHVSVSWDDLSAIMHRVEVEGSPRKDRSGMSYLQTDYRQNK